MKRRILFPILAVVLALGLALPVAANGAVTMNYGDVTLEGGFQAGHFDDIWDLTDGDIELSFTYNATGLVDDFGGGAHAWSQLGVRSVTWAAKTVDLIAGQHIDVGDVVVQRVGDDLCVEYLLSAEALAEGWFLTETHLAIATNSADIPQTKKGNPIPGQFLYGDDDLGVYDGDGNLIGGAPSYSECISLSDLGIGPEDEIYVAAHAVVMRETTTELVTNGDFETPEVTAAQDWDIFDSPAGGWTVAWWDGSTSYGGQPRPDPAHLELHEGVNGWLPYDGDQHAELDTDWDGPGGGLNNEPASVEISQTLAACPSGLYTLRYAWSPRPNHSDNAIQVLWNGDVIDCHSGAGVSNTDWTLEEHEYISGPSSDTVALAFRETGNADSLGMFLDSVSVVCIQEETAWADEYDFPGKNWATYFTYSQAVVPNDFNPTWDVEGSGVWLATDYDWNANTFDPDPVGSPTLDMDDKLILQKAGGHGEADYNLPSTPPTPGANHRIWWDRDGVDPWQNDETANTGGIYTIEITLHATSLTSGEAYMNIRGLDQGFEVDGDWSTIELTPAGMTFTGDMKHLQVFYGLYGYGATHTVRFTDITVTQ